MTLADRITELTAATSTPYTPPAATRSSHPQGFEPGVRYDPSGAMTVTTPLSAPLAGEDDWTDAVRGLGLTVPAGWRVRLVEARHDPAAWTRENQGEDAVTRPIWRYRFRVEPSLAGVSVDELLATTRRARPTRARAIAAGPPRAFLFALGDLQLGKVDGDGVEGVVDRFYAATEAQVARLRELRRRAPVSSVYLAWLGDCVEGFVSQGGTNAWRTTLTMTEQVRVLRRLMLDQVDAFRPLADRLVLCSIPGNHDEAVRFGKSLTRYDDSWAVEAAVSVADAMRVNPRAYGHVAVVVPGRDELTLALDLEGTTVGLAHGHQMRAGKALDWWAQQAHGMQPVGDATLLLTAHLHHLRVEQQGPKTHVQVPSLEAESTWWRHRTGQVSPPGTVSMLVGAGSWSDLQVLGGAA